MGDARTWVEVFARVTAAVAIGGAVGINRDLHHKPVGVRTLGMVAMTGCVLVLAAMRYAADAGGNSSDAVSRVLQGLVTGIGFLGAGVIIRSPHNLRVHGLTTAASIVAVAVLGAACGMAAWPVVAAGVAGTLFLLVWGGPIERAMHARLRQPASPATQEDSQDT